MVRVVAFELVIFAAAFVAIEFFVQVEVTAEQSVEVQESVVAFCSGLIEEVWFSVEW